jgi:hypothetical protein
MFQFFVAVVIIHFTSVEICGNFADPAILKVNLYQNIFNLDKL